MTEFSTIPRLVKTEAKFRPERIKFGVEEFYGWSMCNIINHFVDKAAKEPLTEWERMQFRRAILVSDEVQKIARRERLNV